MNMSVFKNDLIHSKFFERLFRRHTVVAIILKGSQILSVTDDRSDYDLDVIVDEDIKTMEPPEYLMYEGKKVHWYYNPLCNEIGTSLDKTKFHMLLDIVGLIQYNYVNEEHIIYRNEKYNDAINNILNNKHNIARLACTELYRVKETYINEIINTGKITEKYYTKFLYHFCVMSYLLNDNEEFDRDFLISIKRIRWQPVSDEYKDKIIERLKLLKELMER